jgi:WavE lipopolysaccharide synthesis
MTSPRIIRFWRRLMWETMRRANRDGDEFITYHARPKYARQFATARDAQAPYERMAIVMQGPLLSDYRFTEETLKLYRRNFVDCKLVLSTWSDTPESALTPIRALGVDVVLCEKPESAGLFNVNMQIVSAARGVQHAIQCGADWIMKTRTDQRLNDPNVMSFLLALIKTFPVAAGFEQKHRIVGIGHGSLKYGLYHLTDQTLFGHASDMLRYWTPALRNDDDYPKHWPKSLSEMCLKTPIGEMNRYGSAETYLASQFLISVGRRIDWTLADTWGAFKDHFCIADYESTDFFWAKYQLQRQREFPVEYERPSNRREISFREWLLLHAGHLLPEQAAEAEGILAQRFEWPMPDAAFQPLK